MRAGRLGLIFAAVVTLAPAAASTAAISVVATTTDLAALVAAVGGDLVEVQALVPPGADAEGFEPKPADLDRVRRANLLVRVGLGYDFWLDALTARYTARTRRSNSPSPILCTAAANSSSGSVVERAAA